MELYFTTREFLLTGISPTERERIVTQEEKDAICKQTCARYTTPGMHSLFCPYTLDRWMAGKRDTSGISVQKEKVNARDN